MKKLLDKILVRLGLIISPSILFDLAMLGEKSTYYEKYYKKYKKKHEWL
ncbi:MAG: hypothetical protein ACLSAJ_12480 [Intestinibacter bartlettii]